MAKAKREKFTGPLTSEQQANRAVDIRLFVTTASLLSSAVDAIEEELATRCDDEQIELLCRYFGCDAGGLAYRILTCTELVQR